MYPWMRSHNPWPAMGETAAPVSLRALHHWLHREHAYAGSHRSVVRYVHRRYPRIRLRSYSHVETTAGVEPHADRFGPAWVLRLLLGKASLPALREMVGDVPDLQLLYRAVREGGCKR